MIRSLFYRLQVFFVSALLLASLVMLMGIVLRYNHRWDFTPEKLYTLSAASRSLLSQMNAGEIEVIAFYPNDDLHEEFEIFLKECQTHHPKFTYQFFDPNRRPQLAKRWNVRELYTVVIRYQERQERLYSPNERAFAEALMRLLTPKNVSLCLLQETGDPRFSEMTEEGLQAMRQYLESHNVKIEAVPLENAAVAPSCDILAVAGPQSDWTPGELKLIREAMDLGRSILFLIDPMEVDSGSGFEQLMKDYGVRLTRDVVVDKMSHAVGGDFLMPFVNRYDLKHSLTQDFATPTFFPIARTVRALPGEFKDLQVTELAFTGSNSWAESNLEDLQKGDTGFEPEKDDPGPLSLAVAVEMKQESLARMVVIGDSDFVSNAYLAFAGNRQFLMRMIRWLAHDERKVAMDPKYLEFRPLLLTSKTHFWLLLTCLLIFPGFFLLAGILQKFWRRKTS